MNGKKWVVTETFRGNGESEVSAHPLNWIKGNILFWPRDQSKQALTSKLRSCVEPGKSWKKFDNFEILEQEKMFG